jgi:glycosyltransferase involved in cell wall biosynthesis
VHILFLSRWLPFPADNGAKIRALNIVKTLAGRHEVDLLAFSSEDEATRRAALSALGGVCASVQIIPYRPFRPTSGKALRGLLSPQPRFLVDTFSQEMARAVRETCRRRPADLVIASQLDMAPYALLPGTLALLEELELSTYRDPLAAGAPVAARLRAAPTWLKMSAYLRRILPRFAACTVVSERERDLLRSAAPAYGRVAVIPNAVDLDHYQGEYGPPEGNTLVHAGALSYKANLDAVGYFLGDIFPAVRASVNDAHLRVTGAAPPDLLTRLPVATGVEFTGYLADVRPTIARSWLSIAPLRLGGGTRLKILESMALGTPVVATPKGAEGLAVTDGREILIGATPESFAHAVVSLLQSPDLRARLAAAGRRRVEADYSWAAVGRDLLRLVEAIPSGSGRPMPTSEPAHAGAASGVGVARGERP